jgi:hypothetical protein
LSEETNDGAGDGDVVAGPPARPGAPDAAELPEPAGAGLDEQVVPAADPVDAPTAAPAGGPDGTTAGTPAASPVESLTSTSPGEALDAPASGPAHEADALDDATDGDHVTPSGEAPAEAKKKDKSGKGKKGKGGGGKKKALLAAGQSLPPEPPSDGGPPVPEALAGGAVGTPAGSRSGAGTEAEVGELRDVLAGEHGEARGGFGGWLASNVVVLIVAVIAIVAIVGLVLSLLQVGSRDSVEGARTTALAAAKTDAVDIASYDYRHLDQDFGVVLAHSTPSFRQSFGKSSDELKTTLVKFHATAQATVVAAGIVSATADRAVVLVFLEQTVTNSAQKAPTTDRSQVEITLVNTGGNWLIDQVTLL